MMSSTPDSGAVLTADEHFRTEWTAAGTLLTKRLMHLIPWYRDWHTPFDGQNFYCLALQTARQLLLLLVRDLSLTESTKSD